MFVTSSPDLRFLDPFTVGPLSFGLDDGGEDEEPR